MRLANFQGDFQVSGITYMSLAARIPKAYSLRDSTDTHQLVPSPTHMAQRHLL